MGQQDVAEWLNVTKNGKMDYHEKQYDQHYRSTMSFCDWLESLKILDASRKLRILDLGAGQGANIFYMAKRFPNSEFVGVDINLSLVKWGNESFAARGVKNCHLLPGDLYALEESHREKYNGIVSYQTLSWLPEYQTPLEKMMQLNPEWIALTSLFYEGSVTCTIQVQDNTRPVGEKPYRQCYYNVYSLPLVEKLFADHGYTLQFIPFEIDVDLPKPPGKGLGTYTEKLANGKRIQISGPLLMSWYFILAKRSK